MAKWIVRYLIRPKWVSFEYSDANGENELGISIFGVIIGLYKGDTMYPNNPNNIRAPEKREFGESIYPVKEY